jgi:hypothetical protein
VKWGKKSVGLSEEGSRIGFKLTFQNEVPSKLAMENGENCMWYLLKLGDEYAVQYNGPDPDKHFPQATGNVLLNEYN